MATCERCGREIKTDLPGYTRPVCPPSQERACRDAEIATLRAALAARDATIAAQGAALASLVAVVERKWWDAAKALGFDPTKIAIGDVERIALERATPHALEAAAELLRATLEWGKANEAHAKALRAKPTGPGWSAACEMAAVATVALECAVAKYRAAVAGKESK